VGGLWKRLLPLGLARYWRIFSMSRQVYWLHGMRGHNIRHDSADAQDFTLEAWYRTIEEVQALGPEWLGPSEPARQFDLRDDREKKEIFDRALADLPRRYRDVLLLHYVRGRPVQEIAAELKIPESRVPHVRYQALLRLRAAVMERLKDPC